MNFRSLYNRLDNFVRYVFRCRFSKTTNHHHIEDFKKNNIPIKKLTKEQKNEVLKVWKNNRHIDFVSHELYYSLTGVFDPTICPETLFRVVLDPKLNDRTLTRAWNDKAYFDRFLPNVQWPYSYVRNINGVFYDHDYRIISQECAVDFVQKQGRSIIKPSLESGCGRNIRLISSEDDIESILRTFGSNYVIQVLIKQHETLAQFSRNSVNIVRMNTLLIRGKAHMLSSSLRASTVDSVTDNGAIGDDGDGMIIIGVNRDGTLKDTAYYANGKPVTSLDNGLIFGGIRLPNFDEAVRMVENAHEEMGHFGLLAWDVAFDENGQPIVIEYNLNGMGAFYYQLACGPLFAEYTKDVVDIVL